MSLNLQSYHPEVGHEYFASLDEEINNHHDWVKGVLVVVLPGPLSDTDWIIEDQPEHETNPHGQRIAWVEEECICCRKHLKSKKILYFDAVHGSCAFKIDSIWFWK